MNPKATDPTIQTIKEELVNSALFGIFILIIPALLTSVFRAFNQGWQTVYYWHVIASCLIVITWVLRKYISINLRGTILILTFYITGLSGYYSYGLSSFASVYMITVVLFATVLFGYKIAFVALTTCFLSILFFYLAIHYGKLTYPIDFNAHHKLFSSWSAIMFSFLMFSVMITLLLGKLLVRLRDIIGITESREERFRLMIKNSNDSFVLINEKGEQIYISDAATRDTGFEVEELKGPIKNVIYPEDWNTVQNAWIRVLQTKGEIVRVQYRHKHKFKPYIWYEAAAQNFLDNPAIKAVVVNVRDITPIKDTEAELTKAKEKAEESDRLKSAFLANMSHEIRTPMNAIIGFSDFISKPDLADEKRASYTKLIQQKSFDLLQIIEDILDVSKIEIGQLKLNPSEFRLNEFMDDLYQFFSQKIQNSPSKKAIQLRVIRPKELDQIKVKTDQQRLNQIFTNLIDNAIKFTETGYVEFGYEKQTDGNVLFFVFDSGIGIAPEKHELIFDRFRQADDSLTAKKYGGTGLGLSIVKGIIQQFNGKIWLESSSGNGTRFFFTLPMSFEVDKTISIKKESSNYTPCWENKLLLIVEDDYANTEFLIELLTDTGIRIMNAYTGEDTLRLVKENPNIDLILMDICLPDINGLELTKIIRKSYPRIKIIAQTAYASTIELQSCIDAGCSNYITKPIKSEKLLAQIQTILERQTIMH